MSKTAQNRASNAECLMQMPVTYSPALDHMTKWYIVVVVTLVTAMEFLTSYAVAVALPDIQGDLAASFDEGSWILTTYTTCFLVGLVLSNWLADRIGYRRHMIFTVAFFMVSSAGCGFSRTLAQMLVCRGFMGFAGGNFLVRAQTSIYRTHIGFKERFWPLFVLVFGVVVFARTFAPVIGGYITEWYSWRYIFFLNVPLALTAMAGLSGLPDFKAKIEQSRLDTHGLMLLIGWLAPLQIVLSRGERDDWFADPLIRIMSFTVAICLPLFIWWESRSENRNPIIDLKVFRIRNFALGSIYVNVLGMMLYGQLYIIPQFLRNVQHHSAFGTGKLQGINAAAFAVGLVTGGLLMKPIGIRRALAIGATVFCVGMWCWVTRFTTDISDPAMVLPLILTGFGAGWQIGPMSVLINCDLPNALMGVGMELYLCLRQLGGSWGIAILTILIDRRRSFWSSRLGEHINDYNLTAQEALRQGTAALQLAGFPHEQAQTGAMHLLRVDLLVQSTVNAFVDTYLYQFLVGGAAILLILLSAKKPLLEKIKRWSTADSTIPLYS